MRELLRDRTVALLLSVELLDHALRSARPQPRSAGRPSRASTIRSCWASWDLPSSSPQRSLRFPAGHVADRYDRRWVGASGIAIMIVSRIGAFAIDAAAGDSQVWPLYVVGVRVGVGDAYAGPAVGPLLAGGRRRAIRWRGPWPCSLCDAGRR